MDLVANGSANEARATQPVTLDAGKVGQEHVLAVRVRGAIGDSEGVTVGCS